MRKLWSPAGPWEGTWVLFWELGISAWAIWAWTREGLIPTPGATVTFAVLSAAAGVHMAGTRRAEEARRREQLAGEHIDLTGIYTMAAAWCLPVPLMILLVLGIRWHRNRIARKPAFQVLFGTFAIIGPMLAVHEIAVSTPAQAIFMGIQTPPTDPVGVLVLIAVLTAALVAYYVVQSVMVGVGRACRIRRRRERVSWSMLLGDVNDNITLALTLTVGLLAAWLCALLYGLPQFVLAAAAVIFTRAVLDRDRYEQESMHDRKTGLNNDRGFYPQAETAFALDSALGRPTCALMADIDFFKRWNQLLLEVEADQILRAVANVIRQETRKADRALACRWGGEEFLVLLTNTDASGGQMAADRIRGAVEALELEVTLPRGGEIALVGPGRDLGSCTVSIGVAQATMDDTLENLIKKANLAKAEAKQRGRNRVHVTEIDPARSTPSW